MSLCYFLLKKKQISRPYPQNVYFIGSKFILFIVFANKRFVVDIWVNSCHLIGVSLNINLPTNLTCMARGVDDNFISEFIHSFENCKENYTGMRFHLYLIV